MTIPGSATCPLCDKRLHAATAVDGSENYPMTGDFTVCLYCRTVLVFDDELRPRMPTPTEHDQAMATPSLRFAIFVATQVAR